MKRYFTLMLLTLCLATVYAQQNYKVSTEDQKRGILLEEFTGAYCPNCPDGHQIASSIVKSFKGQVVPVSIHTGNYSPNNGDFILRTDDGETIAMKFKPQGFPTGMVSRHDFGKGYVFGRDQWSMQTKKLSEETATVNLYAESSFDGGSRELKIHVEGYNAADNSSNDMRLNIMLLQDNIIGHQSGSAEGENYHHMHVLRDCITDAEGDAISSKAQGEYFTADYTYTMPKEIRGQELKAEDANIVVFVTSDGMSEVVNAIGLKPTYSNMNITPAAELVSPKIEIGSTYGFQFFEAGIYNYSEEVLTKAVFDVDLNGEVTEVTADCNIKAFETGYVKIPCSYTFNANGKMTYELKLKRTNNNDVKPVTLSGSFERPVVVENEVLVDIKTDKSSDENEFTLKDKDGNVVMTFGPFDNGKTNKFQKKIKLEKANTYCVEITDNAGNGMEHGTRGHLIVTSGSNDLIDYIDNIPAYGARVFFTIENDLSIEGIEVEDNGNGKIYSLNGMVLNGSNSNARIIIKNGKKYINR